MPILMSIDLRLAEAAVLNRRSLAAATLDAGGHDALRMGSRIRHVGDGRPQPKPIDGSSPLWRQRGAPPRS
jgi:hypothetical protein